MQLDYRCYVHFRDAAAFDRALDLLTVKTTAGAFPFRKLAETFSNMKAMTKAMDTPLGQVFDTVTAPRNEQFLFIHDHYKNLQTYMAMTEEIFDELYEEDPNSFLMIADVTNFDDDSLGDVVWYYLGGKDYTRFIDPDMERHGIELSDWKGMLAGQPLTQAQKDWAQRITGGCQPQNMMAHFPMETSVYKGYKRDKIEMRGDRAEMSDFPLYLNTVAGGLDRRDQTIGGFSFVVKIYAVPVIEIIE